MSRAEIATEMTRALTLATRQAVICKQSSMALESLFDDLVEAGAPGGFVALLLAAQHLDRACRVLYTIADACERVQKSTEQHSPLTEWEPRFTRAAEQLQAGLDFRVDTAADNATDNTDPWEGAR